MTPYSIKASPTVYRDVINSCVRQHDILKPKMCFPTQWPSVNLSGLTVGHICHTANISDNPNIIEYDELYLHHLSCKLSRPPASH